MNPTLLILLNLVLASLVGWLWFIKDAKKYEIEELQKKLESERSVNAAAQSEWKRLNDARNAQLHALQQNNNSLLASKVRLSRLVRILRLREDPTQLQMTWLKTEETDVRICKVRVREQLAIELENAGALKYKVQEWDDPKLGGPQIGVTASINLLNFNDDARKETTSQNL